MSPSAEPLGVHVLGMHRSGTSAATRVIDLLGVPVAERGLIPESSLNPAGYWEVGSLMAVNDHLLQRLGGSWRMPPPLENLAAADRLLEDLLGPAEQVFRNSHAGPQWVWKDPRNCLLFGFWRRALSEPAIVVFVHRSPDEVIASLRAYEMTAAVAAALWERHVRSARLLACDVPSIVIDYGRLVEAPDEEIQRLAAFLGGHGARLDPEGPRRAAQSVRAELHRHRAGAAETAPPVPLSPEQASIATMLSEAARAGAPLAVVSPPPETQAIWHLLSPRTD